MSILLRIGLCVCCKIIYFVVPIFINYNYIFNKLDIRLLKDIDTQEISYVKQNRKTPMNQVGKIYELISSYS